MERKIPLFCISEEEKIRLSRKLLEGDLIDTAFNQKVLALTPYAQDFGDGAININSAADIIKRTDETNRVLPALEKYLVEITTMTLEISQNLEFEPQRATLEYLRTKIDSEEMATNALLVPTSLLLSLSEIPNINKDQMRLALSHLGVKFGGLLYKKSDDEKIKTIGLTFAIYYASLNAIFVGVKTNDTLFATYPQQTDISVLNHLKALINLRNRKEVELQRLRSLFEGAIVNPIIDIDEEHSYFIDRGIPKEHS